MDQFQDEACGLKVNSLRISYRYPAPPFHFFRPLYLTQPDTIQAGTVSLKWALKQGTWASVQYLTGLFTKVSSKNPTP